MERKSVGNSECPVALSLERVGEWWSILILRDAFYGLSRFEQFRSGLEIAPNILTRRLRALVDDGILERRAYQTRPLRHEYVLTDRGRDFRPVILSLLAWGSRHFAPEGRSMDLIDATTGRIIDPILADRKTGVPLEHFVVRTVLGPDAGLGSRRYANRHPGH